MDYFNDVFPTFLDLKVSTALERGNRLRFHQKYLNLYSEMKEDLPSFGTHKGEK